MAKKNRDIYMNKSKMYINEYGDKEYRDLKNQLHRVNGPAIEWKNGTKFWFKEGGYHRIDGPAIEWSNGYKYWCILNEFLEEKEFNSWISRIKIFV